jgi:hypothetical protein
MFFLLRFGFLFLVFRLFDCAGSCAKAESPAETRHHCALFLIGPSRAVKIP